MSRRFVAVLATVCTAAGAAGAATPLPRLRADPAQTTVSGLSSGAFMAVQYATAFSASVVGVGVIAGGPYDCAQSTPGGVDACMTGRPSDAGAWAAAQRLAAQGRIDPVAGIARQRVYLFSGRADRTVVPGVVAATRRYYRDAGVPDAAIAWRADLPAGHAFLSPTAAGACGSSAAPYIERCLDQGRPYDQPAAILRHLLGSLAAARTTPTPAPHAFDQREFAAASTSLDATGYVYIPADCRDASTPACRVHVVFHGCRQGAESVGGAVTARLGFNRWADANRVVVLYPQVATSASWPFNPQGCWDWWGRYGWFDYTGPAYATRDGVQLAAVKAMVDRLTGRP